MKLSIQGKMCVDSARIKGDVKSVMYKQTLCYILKSVYSWTEEVFTITKRVLRRPPVYKIADFDDEELKGTFYEQELQKVNKSDSDFYRVEEILRSRMRNKRKEYFVKWLGYPDKFNSWVPAESVKDIK